MQLGAGAVGGEQPQVRPGGREVQAVGAPEALAGGGQPVPGAERVARAGRGDPVALGVPALRGVGQVVGVGRAGDPGAARRQQGGPVRVVGAEPAAQPPVGEPAQHRAVGLCAPEQFQCRAQGLRGRPDRGRADQQGQRGDGDHGGAVRAGRGGQVVEPRAEPSDVAPVALAEDGGGGQGREVEQAGEGEQGDPAFGDPAAQRAEEGAGHRSPTARSGSPKTRHCEACAASGTSTRPQWPCGQARTCSGGWPGPATGRAR